MERKDFLKGLGIVSVGSVMPLNKVLFPANGDVAPTADCTLTPTDEEGPFPYPGGEITAPSALLRSEVRETQTGVMLTLTLTLTNLSCQPLSGMRVDIWSCNSGGFYSGYIQPGGNYTGTTFLRGYQYTNANGEVTFTTLYPGWYNGRINHIHLEIFSGTSLKKTSQLCFPDTLNSTVNSFYGRPITGGSPATNAADHVFSDTANTALEILTLNGNTTSGYTATRTLTIDFAILPLTLLSFEGAVSGRNNMLWWKTTDEMNANRFEVERSANASAYTKIGTVAAKNGNAENNYNFTDENAPAGKSYYRLKMIDNDGAYKYSNIVVLKRDGVKQITVSPNPASGNIVLTHPQTGSFASIKVFAADGRAVATGKLTAGATSTSVNISMLASGTYFLVFENDADKQVTRFVKK